MADNKDKKVLNVPALRFPEFKEGWKREILNDVCTFHNGRAYKQNELLSDGKYRVLRVGNFFTNDSWYYSDLELDDEKVAVNGDLLYAWSASFGPRFWTGEKVIYHYHIWKIDSFQQVSKEFLFYFLERDTEKIKNEVQGGTMVHITKGDMEKREILYPSILEQSKIARLLSLLDERIATQNKIIEDLRLLRDAIMVEHYRKCNKSELCIYDIGEPFNVMNLSKDDLTKDGSPCIIYGELFTTYGCVIENVVSHTTKSLNSTLSIKGDLLFPASTTVDALSLIAPSSINEDGIILGGDMFGIHVNEQYNSNYLSYYFNIIGKKNLAKYAKGSTIIHLHYADIQKAKITLPNNNEQEAVANLLLKVEHKLNIEQKMLINYLNIKNFLLRQMFI